MTAVLSLGEPWVRALLLPFVASGAAVAVIRLLLGEGRGAILSNAGIGLGILAAHLAIFGLPDWPANGLVEKMFWLAAGGLVLGALVDRFSVPMPIGLVLILGWPVLSILWIVQPDLGGHTSGLALLRFGGLIVGGIIIFVRLDQEQDNGQNAPLMVLWAGATLAGLAALYGLMTSGEIAAAVAAATLGYLIWNIPVSRYPMGHATILPAGSIILALSSAFIVVRPGADLALLFLVALFFANRIGNALFKVRRKTTPFVVTLGALLPAAASLAIAWLLM